MDDWTEHASLIADGWVVNGTGRVAWWRRLCRQGPEDKHEKIDEARLASRELRGGQGDDDMPAA
jgi:hypothetical protein